MEPDIQSDYINAPVLVVDDDEAQLKTLADILELEDMQPICCTTGQAALEICRQQAINVAIIDLRLPDTNGLQLLKDLKIMNPDIHIIINTAYASLESALDAINRDAFAFVRKMGDVEELLAHIHRAFHKHLARYNERLEVEVEKRTAALLEANNELKYEITQRKQAETALQFQKTLLENQSEASLDGILVVSQERKWIFHNRRFLEMWDFPDDIIATGSSTAAVDWVKQKLLDPDQFIFQTEYLYKHPELEGRDELIRKDGRMFDRYSAPVRDAAGVNYGRVWYYRDITEQKQLEVQLNQVQKMEAVGQLAGGMAHNFNNILTAIMGYAGLAIAALPDAHPITNDLEGIQKTAQRGAHLIRQLLAFTSNQIMKPQVLNLNDLVVELNSMLRQLISKNIELVTRLEPDLELVEIDPIQFEQVLINLVVNARDAMPNGGKLIIETGNLALDSANQYEIAELGPGRYVSLGVTDTGLGISEADSQRIFEPFYTTKEVGKGTGLGLATCFGIIKQNMGHISVASTEGQGTTFTVYLPEFEGRLATQGVEKKLVPLPGALGTILLVEDENAVRLLVSRILRHQGYKVLEAANGATALALVEDQPDVGLDLLITDVVMPGMNGPDLANKLRTRLPSLRILYISGYADDTIAHYGVSGDANFLQKPFSPVTLARKVTEVLRTP